MRKVGYGQPYAIGSPAFEGETMAGKHSSVTQQPSATSESGARGGAYVPQPDAMGSYPRKRRGGCLIAALVALLVAALAAGGVYFYLYPPRYDVTINGQTVTIDRDATIADVIEAGYAAPVAGNLLAIDGNVAVPGGGTPFTATVDGVPTTDANTKLAKDAVVEISNGTDTTETFTVSEEVIPHGQREIDTSAGAYWAGSLHVYEKGQDGLNTTKVGDVSGAVITEQTVAPVDSGYHIYTANVGEDKVIALTFDDGPWPETTDQILDILEANGARATFFTIGNQVQSYAAQVQREQALGCQTCTHTWDHASGSGQGVNITYMSAEEQIAEVQQGYDVLREVLGVEPAHILRAPGGNYYGDAIFNLEPYVDAEVGWDVDTEDWRRPGADAIYERIMSVQPGQVILMHDGGGDRSQTVEAVSRAVPELVAQGYQLVTINDLLAYGH